MENQMIKFTTPAALGSLSFNIWDRDGEPWFVAIEVLDMLGLRNLGVTKSLQPLDDDEKAQGNLYDLAVVEQAHGAKRGNPNRWFVSASGLLKLIARSKKPEVVAFRDWIDGVVLPHFSDAKAEADIDNEMTYQAETAAEAVCAGRAPTVLFRKLEALLRANAALRAALDEANSAETEAA
jgi:prophage antirepressor-like protein